MDNDIKQISIEDKNYPDSLKKIPGSPRVLYYRGNFVQENENCFAIVGTRRPSPYGQQSTIHIAGDLSGAGLTIVSGLAPGIDTFAHKACVEKNKRTIAVLGTGLDEMSIYPRQNLELAKKIIDSGGCLISELEPGTHGTNYTFPRRNRIISGLSSGVLVIEAKERSGSLITADYAKEQRKKLFAVPGPIFSQNSKGPNKLIKQGAKLVQTPNDILEDLNLNILKNPLRPESENPEETLIMNALKEGCLYIDIIIEKTKLNASAVATRLALMEISGKIRNLGQNIYALS